MTDNGLITAYLLDGHGGGQQLGRRQVHDWQSTDGLMWMHLQRDAAETPQLLADSGLEQVVIDALLAEDTRPRCAQMGNGILVFLRGVNLNPGADPEDMVSIRIWIDVNRIISVRIRRLLSVDDLRAALDAGNGPENIGEFAVQLSGFLSSRMVGVISELDDQIDRIQDRVLVDENLALRGELASKRREIISLRRYLAPQRDAMLRLTQLKATWLDEGTLLKLREESDRLTRLVEDLDAARERAAVTQEELSSRLAEQMNRRMYVLSIVAGVFLPLGFLTGLLGVNVGGIPLADSPWGFAIMLVVLSLITALEIWLFRWRKWF